MLCCVDRLNRQAERSRRHGRIAMGVTYDGNAGDRGHSARVRRTGAIDPLSWRRSRHLFSQQFVNFMDEEIRLHETNTEPLQGDA